MAKRIHIQHPIIIAQYLWKSSPHCLFIYIYKIQCTHILLLSKCTLYMCYTTKSYHAQSQLRWAYIVLHIYTHVAFTRAFTTENCGRYQFGIFENHLNCCAHRNVFSLRKENENVIFSSKLFTPGIKRYIFGVKFLSCFRV